MFVFHSFSSNNNSQLERTTAVNAAPNTLTRHKPIIAIPAEWGRVIRASCPTGDTRITTSTSWPSSANNKR